MICDFDGSLRSRTFIRVGDGRKSPIYRARPVRFQ